MHTTPSPRPTGEPVTLLDNRGLEPPMPMVHTLEAYGELAPGAMLRIHNDRVPVYLLPQLEERGARYEVHEQEDGSAFVDIRKPTPGEDEVLPGRPPWAATTPSRSAGRRASC